ncbi:MAG TPA: hypothetical protein VEU74_04265 [Gemmatimonadales bacterium]|nr:hypothetical protein [Gemmatimonadales bacterium]
MHRTLVTLFALTAALAGAPAAGAAQAPAESIAVWTQRLQSPTLADRVQGMGRLAGEDPRSFPPATQSAILAELTRVNEALQSNVPIDGATALGSEGFGEYYLDLARTARSLNTPEANRALILSVGVSLGTSRRVARLGDGAIPSLAHMIDQDYEPGAALETMGLAWFWADSTGAVLSDASRGVIVRALLASSQSGSDELRSSVGPAFRWTGDPAFLPLAQAIAARAQVSGDLLLSAAYFRINTLPSLTAALNKLGPLGSAVRTRRVLGLVCSGTTSGARQGACESLENELDAAIAHLQAGRTGPAANVLEAVARRADAAVAIGALTQDEAALIAGGARQVIARL